MAAQGTALLHFLVKAHPSADAHLHVEYVVGVVRELRLLAGRGGEASNDEKADDKAASALKEWLSYIQSLLKDGRPASKEAGCVLLAETIRQGSLELIAAHHALWFGFLHNWVIRKAEGAESPSLVNAATATMLALFTRLCETPDLKRTLATNYLTKTMPAICDMAVDPTYQTTALHTIATLIPMLGSTLRPFLGKMEEAGVAGLRSTAVVPLAAQVLAMLVRVSGNGETWLALTRRLLLSLQHLMGHIYAVFDDASQGRGMAAAAPVPAGAIFAVDQLPPSTNPRHVQAVRAHYTALITALVTCLGAQGGLEGVVLPVPAREIVAFATRVFGPSVQGVASLAGRKYAAGLAPSDLASIHCDLRVGALSAVAALATALRRQLLPFCRPISEMVLRALSDGKDAASGSSSLAAGMDCLRAVVAALGAAVPEWIAQPAFESALDELSMLAQEQRTAVATLDFILTLIRQASGRLTYENRLNLDRAVVSTLLPTDQDTQRGLSLPIRVRLHEILVASVMRPCGPGLPLVLSFAMTIFRRGLAATDAAIVDLSAQGLAACELWIHPRLPVLEFPRGSFAEEVAAMSNSRPLFNEPRPAVQLELDVSERAATTTTTHEDAPPTRVAPVASFSLSASRAAAPAAKPAARASLVGTFGGDDAGESAAATPMAVDSHPAPPRQTPVQTASKPSRAAPAPAPMATDDDDEMPDIVDAPPD